MPASRPSHGSAGATSRPSSSAHPMPASRPSRGSGSATSRPSSSAHPRNPSTSSNSNRPSAVKLPPDLDASSPTQAPSSGELVLVPAQYHHNDFSRRAQNKSASLDFYQITFDNVHILDPTHHSFSFLWSLSAPRPRNTPFLAATQFSPAERAIRAKINDRNNPIRPLRKVLVQPCYYGTEVDGTITKLQYFENSESREFMFKVSLATEVCKPCDRCKGNAYFEYCFVDPAARDLGCLSCQESGHPCFWSAAPQEIALPQQKVLDTIQSVEFQRLITNHISLWQIIKQLKAFPHLMAWIEAQGQVETDFVYSDAGAWVDFAELLTVWSFITYRLKVHSDGRPSAITQLRHVTPNHMDDTYNGNPLTNHPQSFRRLIDQASSVGIGQTLTPALVVQAWTHSHLKAILNMFSKSWDRITREAAFERFLDQPSIIRLPQNIGPNITDDDYLELKNTLQNFGYNLWRMLNTACHINICPRDDYWNDFNRTNLKFPSAATQQGRWVGNGADFTTDLKPFWQRIPKSTTVASTGLTTLPTPPNWAKDPPSQA